MKMRFVINVEPMGAARMTQRGKWTSPKAQRYLHYKSVVGWQIKAQYNGEPTEAACGVEVTFHMPIPGSWSLKKRLAAIGKPVTVKPDIDNLVKGLFDSMNGLIWKDDNLVVDCKAAKVYAIEPRIELTVTELF